MFSLDVGFSVWMHKRAASAQGETTPSFEVSGRKCPKRFGPNEEAQKSLAVIVVDSPKRSFDALPALECASQDASREACASLEDEVPSGGLPNADRAISEALAVGETIGPPL